MNWNRKWRGNILIAYKLIKNKIYIKLPGYSVFPAFSQTLVRISTDVFKIFCTLWPADWRMSEFNELHWQLLLWQKYIEPLKTWQDSFQDKQRININITIVPSTECTIVFPLFWKFTCSLIMPSSHSLFWLILVISKLY